MLTVCFFIEQQVKSFTERWWAVAGSGGLRKGDEVWNKHQWGWDREQNKDEMSGEIEGLADESVVDFIRIPAWSIVTWDFFFPQEFR